MTILAIVAAADVGRMLASCDRAVVTTGTRAKYLRVINGIRGGKDIRRMTVFTDFRRNDVSRVLTRGVDTIVAANAVAGDIDMVKIGWQPGDGRVTIVTIVAAGYVRRVFTGRCIAVMTGSTATEHLCVIDHCCWIPNVGVVTVFANVR